MEIIVKHGCPLLLESTVAAWAFILLPGLFAAMGARLLQGSFLRIIGGALGGGLRDFLICLSLSKGWLEVTNPDFEINVARILIFFGAAGGALGACLAPYRGKLLMLNSAIGAILGQFCLPYIMFKRRPKGSEAV